MNTRHARLPTRALRPATVLLLALLTAATTSIASGLRVVELAVEARAADLSLPLTDVGSVTVRACTTCKSVSLLTGVRARYLLDGEAVSLAQLRTALRATPETAVVVLYARGSTEITRIIATSPAASRR